MTTEELLKDRYKIIAPIPFKEEEDFWKVGEILDRDWGWNGNDDDGFKYHISNYPHLFKKLEWWEDRELNDMPEYVKCIKTPDQKIMPEQVFKVKWHAPCAGRTTITGEWVLVETDCFIPATAAEYEQYINKKQNDEQDTK